MVPSLKDFYFPSYRVSNKASMEPKKELNMKEIDCKIDGNQARYT